MIFLVYTRNNPGGREYERKVYGIRRFLLLQRPGKRDYGVRCGTWPKAVLYRDARWKWTTLPMSSHRMTERPCTPSRMRVSYHSGFTRTGRLQGWNSANIKGMRGCHLSTDAEDKYIFVSGYHDGKSTVLRLNPDGTVGDIVDGVFH